MKKRLLSALLALALVFVLLPTTALAETASIKIAGTVIEDGKYYYTNGGIGELTTEAQQKTWNVRREGNTLYLRNAKINTTDTQSIQVWMMSVTINLEGDSTIKTKGEGSIVSQFAGSLTINGNGKLTIESNTAGSSIVWNSGDVTITDDAVVNITNENSGQLSDAIGLASSYELTVSENAKLRAVSNGSKAATVNGGKLTIADNAEFNVINQNSSGKAVSFKSIEVATGYDCNGINGNGITEWTKTTAEELNTFQKVLVKPTPTPALEKSNVYVAGTNLYKNTAYTIQEGKPVMGGTYPSNYNIYLDATNYVLHVKNATIEATYTGIYGVSNIVFEGTNSITAGQYGIISYSKQFDLNISGSGSLTVTTYAGNSAIATDYYTSKSIIISGKDFTVTADTSRTNVSAIYSDRGGLTIKDGATVKAISANNSKAIRIGGSLTVTDATLTATSTSDKKPTIEVEGGATLAGSEVKITNNSTRQGTSGENSYGVSTGLYVGGTLDIKNAAKVTSTVIGGNAIYAKGDITISGDGTEVNAQNSAYKFSAISTNGTVNISDNSTVKAENLKKHQGDPTGVTDPSTGKTYNACPAITGKIANKNTQNKLHIEGFTTSNPGTSNPTEGTPLNFDIDPSSAERYILHYDVTITCGDEVARTESPVVIAGTTLLNDTYYTITDGSTVAVGTDSNNYNAFYDSETKTLKLNNAKISTTTNNAAIEIRGDLAITVTGTNELKGNYNHCIESWSKFTINGTGTLEMTNGSNTAASVIYCSNGNSLTIDAEVIIKNEARPGNLIFTVTDNAYSFASGYNVYASTDISGSPLEAYDAAKGSTYKYLRVTKENLAPTTPTTYTVTITGENISKYYSSEGELEQTVTAGKAIKTVTVAANGGYYFPDNYVKDLELPSGITATVSGDNWYLTIKGIPSKDATINLPVLSKRPTITVDIPLPVAGNKPATIDQIHLTCDDPNYTPEITGIRWNKGSLTEESVAIGANDTFVAGTCYNVKIFLSSGIADGAYKLAYAGGGDNPWYAYWGTSNFQLYFQATPAATHTHEKGDLQFNSEGHWYKCAADTSCTERIDFASHTYKDNICTVCNYVKPACSHTNLKYIDNNDYETHKVQCADCEEIIAEKEAHDIQGYVIDDVAGTHQEFCNKCHYRGLALHHSIIYVPKDNGHCKACAICKVQLGRVEEHTFENGVCTVCNATSGEIVPPTPDNPGTIVIIRPAEEEKPAQQPNPSTGANDLVGMAVAAAVVAVLGSVALLRKHD